MPMPMHAHTGFLPGVLQSGHHHHKDPPHPTLQMEILDIALEFAWLAGGGAIIGLATGYLTT